MDYTSIASAFNRPKAKIDFITVGVPSRLSAFSALQFEAAMRGRVCVSDRKHDHWLNVTVHDPEIADLQWFLDNWPEATIWGIEIAVDFTLQDGSNDLDQLMPLHSWFNHRLFPQRHKMLSQARRIRYSHQSGQYERDTLATQGGDSTFQWRDNKQKLQTRLYRKTQDNHAPLEGQHPIRLEATLWRGACQDFDLEPLTKRSLSLCSQRLNLVNLCAVFLCRGNG